MRKIISFMHVTLDGFVAGPDGEMNWIKLDDKVFALAGEVTDHSDTALYGRITFEMMDGYWPTAGDPPDASAHDKKHSAWYNSARKIILSRTMTSGPGNSTILRDNIPEAINILKKDKGTNIVIFGSPSASHYLQQQGLIDEYWLMINPVILGRGIPLFKGITEKTDLRLVDNRLFDCGVIGLHYVKA
jgi:dihydrofolate reductase